MDAPREVWITVRDGKISASRVAGRAPFFGTKFVRADVVAEILGASEQTTKEIAIAARELAAPSAQPSSDQVRRLAEAYKALAVSTGDLNEEEESALKLSEAVLASPEAPAIDSEARHARVREEAEAASKALTMAVHALRSYQHFNSSTELAESAADHCEPVLSALRAALETP